MNDEYIQILLHVQIEKPRPYIKCKHIYTRFQTNFVSLQYIEVEIIDNRLIIELNENEKVSENEM